MTTFRYDALISYRRQEPDKTFARDLLKRLESADLNVAFDEREFAVAAQSLDEMERCIKESRFMLAVTSPRYFESGNCVAEARICKAVEMSEQGRRFIPLIIEEVELPAWLGGSVGIDFTDPDALLDPYDNLVKKLRQGISADERPDETEITDDAETEPGSAAVESSSAAPTEPSEPLESRQWFRQSRQRLQELAQDVLEASDVTRKFILKCNRDLSDSLTAAELADQIFNLESPPISYLRKCANQNRHKQKLSEVEINELGLHLCRLVEIVSPMCSRDEDISTLEPYVNRQVGNHAKVATKEKTVVTSQVACIKGVSADLNKHSDWSVFGLAGLSDSRELVASVPPPPEMGRQAMGKENPVDAFAAVLTKAIHPDQPTLQHVKAKLQSIAENEEIFFVVLFDTQPGDAYLDRIHRTFPELILLVAPDVQQASDAPPTPDVRLAVDIHDLLQEFGPQDPKAQYP